MNIKFALPLIAIVLAQILSACSSPTAAPTPAPTPTLVLTPTADPLLAAKIVQAYWDALAVGDLETALSYVHENITCRGSCYLTGKPMFRTYLEGYIKSGYLTKISDVKNVGNLVSYAWDVYRSVKRHGPAHCHNSASDRILLY